MKGETMRKGVSLVLASAGFGFAMTWCMLVGHSNGFSASVAADSSLNSRVVYLMGILALSLVFVAWPQVVRRLNATMVFAVPLLAAFATLVYSQADRLQLGGIDHLSVGALFAIGLCFFWYLACFVVHLGKRFEFQYAVAAVCCGIVFKTLLVPLVGALAVADTQATVAMVLPFVTSGCLGLSRRLFPGAGRSSSGRVCVEDGVGGDAPRSAMFRRNVLIMLVIVAVLLGVIRSVSNLGIWGTASDMGHWASLLVSCAVVGLFTYFALVRMAASRILLRFQPAMVLVLAGLFAVAIQASPTERSPELLADIIRVDELCTHVLYWTVVLTALSSLEAPAYRIVGFAEAVFAAASLAWLVFLREQALVNNVYVLGAAYLIMIAIMYLTWQGAKRRADEGLSEGQETTEPAQDVDLSEPSPVRSVTQACLAIASEYGLSPRETQVFVLLAQGRTRAFIQDELVLSGSTIKTHVGHIYGKLGVEDRQQMMDLIWR